MAGNKPSTMSGERSRVPNGHRLLLTGIVLLMAIVAMQTASLYSMLKEQLSAHIKELTAQTAVTLDERVNEQISVLSAIAGMLSVSEADTYEECIGILTALEGDYDSMGIITPDGVMYSTAEPPRQVDEGDGGVQAMSNTHAGVYGMVSTPYYRKDGQRMIMCAVDMPEGSLTAGVLYAAQTCDRFAEWLMGDMQDSRVCVTDQSGSVIHMTAPLETLLSGGEYADELKDHIIASTRDDHAVYRQGDYVVSTAQLGFNGWVLTCVIPFADIVDESLSMLAMTALITAVLLALIVLSATLLLTRHARGSADLVREAGVDTLTGIYNHMGFVSAAAALMSRSSAPRYALVFLRSDVQEVYGARYGYEAGRQALEDVARILKSECESGETCARIEGGQFLMLLRFSDTADAILRIKALNSHLMNVCPLRIRSHYGIYAPTDMSESLNQMIEYASEAALRVMRKGDLVGLYDDALHRRQLHEDMLLSRAPDAIKSGDFEVCYCPMRDPDTMDIVSAQAVAIWHQPDGSVLSPGDYMPLLTRNSMMGALNVYVMERICRDMQANTPEPGRGEVPGRVLMHIARENMLDGAFISGLKQTMRRCGVEGSRLEAMISESMLITEPSLTANVIQQLQSLRIRVCVDGFGGDSAALCLLDTMPIDAVRLSQDFVEHTCESERGRQLLSGLMSLLTSLNIDVYSCGALTEAQMETLRACGCRRMGYVTGPDRGGADYCSVSDIKPVRIRKQADPFDDWE